MAGGELLSDWIERLRQETETKARLEAMEKDKQQQEHLLIVAKAPDLWNAFASLIEEDVKRLAAAFPDEEAMNLQFERDLGDKILVTNPSTQKGFTAQWIPDEVIIKLGFREQMLGMQGVQTGQDQINFLVAPSGDVVMMWGAHSGPDKISEVLLKRLLEGVVEKAE
jgi:hypothetical protein